MGKSKFKGKKVGSGRNVYAQAKGDGVQQAHEIISESGKVGTTLTSGRSAAGSRAGRTGDRGLIRGRSDISQAALVDKRKKVKSFPADASIIGSTGVKLGA